MAQKLLGTKISCENNQINTRVPRNDRKLLVNWASKIPKRYNKMVSMLI